MHAWFTLARWLVALMPVQSLHSLFRVRQRALYRVQPRFNPYHKAGKRKFRDWTTLMCILTVCAWRISRSVSSNPSSLFPPAQSRIQERCLPFSRFGPREWVTLGIELYWQIDLNWGLEKNCAALLHYIRVAIENPHAYLWTVYAHVMSSKNRIKRVE